MSLFTRISLIVVLVIGASAELLLNRIGVRLADAYAFHHAAEASTLRHVLHACGLFSFYFTGLLSLAIGTWAVLLLIRDRLLFRQWGRVAVGIATPPFLLLAAVRLFHRLPEQVAPSLNIAFGLAISVLVVAFLSRPAQLRAKIGALYVAVPLLIHSYWVLSQQLPALRISGPAADLPARLQALAVQMVMGGGVILYLLFVPPRRSIAKLATGPFVFALVTTGIAGSFVIQHYALADRVLAYGLGIPLPLPGTLALGVSLISFMFLSLCVATLWRAGATYRSTASGLLLLGLAGFNLLLPHQLLLVFVGLIQLIRSWIEQWLVGSDAELRVVEAPSDEQWKAYLNRLVEGGWGSFDGSADAIVLRHDGNQVARVSGTLDDIPCAIRLLIRAGRLTELEIDVGQPPREDAPATLWRRRGRRGGAVTDGRGPRVRRFDPEFVLRDGTTQVADALASVSPSIKRSIHGWLGLWPGEGLRYLARPLQDGWPVPVAEVRKSASEAPLEPVEQLLELLLTIARRLEVRG